MTPENGTFQSGNFTADENASLPLTNDTGNSLNGTSSNQQNIFFFVLPVIPGWLSSLYLSMLCISIVIGVPGNSITVAAYAKIKGKTNCDWYILFVAALDLIACLFRNTVYIMEYQGTWILYSTSGLCRFISWLSQTNVCVSIFIFALVAIDRYIKLCLSSKWTITPKTSRNICLVLILVNGVMAAPCLFIFENIDRGTCSVKRKLVQNVLVKGYYTLIFALFLVMFVAVIFCYVSIGLKVQKTRRIGMAGIPPSAATGSLRGYDDDGNSAITTVTVNRTCISQRSAAQSGEEALVENQRYARSISTTVSNISTSPSDKSRTVITTTETGHAKDHERMNPQPTFGQVQTVPGSSLAGQRGPTPQSLRVPQSEKPSVSCLMQSESSSKQYGSPQKVNVYLGPSRAFGSTRPSTRGEGSSRQNDCSFILTNDVAVGIRNVDVKEGEENRNYLPVEAGTIQNRNIAVNGLNEIEMRKNAIRHQRNVRITGLLFVVTTVYILSWVPPYIAMVKGFFLGYSFPMSLGEYLLLSYGPNVYVINTFSNPIIYAALSATYRRQISILVKDIRAGIRRACCVR